MFKTVRGDMRELNRLITRGGRFATAYNKGKTKAVYTGLLLATAAVSTIARFAPRIGKKMFKGLKKVSKGRTAGRGSASPKKKQGSMQDDVKKDVENGNNYTDSRMLRKGKMKSLDNELAKGDEGFLNTRNASTLTSKKIKDIYRPLEGEALRIQEQAIEACKRYNMMTNTLQVKYQLEPPLKHRLWVFIEDKALIISEQGIYSMVDNPYYVHGSMDKSDALARLISDFSHRQINLFISVLAIYEQNLFSIIRDTEKRGKEIIDQPKQNLEEPKKLNVLGFSE